MLIKRTVRVVLATVLILLFPLIAMQFTAEVDWNLADFVIMGILLLAVGALLEVATTRTTLKHRIAFAVVVILLFLYVWAELAVGIFNIPGISGS